MEEEKGQGEWPNGGPQSTDAEMHRLTESTVHRLTVTDNDYELRDGMKEGPGGRKGIVRGNLIFLYFLWEHRRFLTFFSLFFMFLFFGVGAGTFYLLFFSFFLFFWCGAVGAGSLG
jgi:hypothetical protein